MAMSGCQELILFDDDKIEESNLARLPVESAHIGQQKLDALKREILNIRKLRLECHNMRVDSPSTLQLLRGTVFCCTDNIKSQQEICAYCRKNNLPYQRIGYDGTILNVCRSFPLTFDDNLPPGYDITPSIVQVCVMAAAAGILSQSLKNCEIVLMDDVRRLHIQDCTNMTGGMAEKLRQEGIKKVKDDPYTYELGSCNDCDRRDCGDCDRINTDDYETMREIVCDGCDHILPDDYDTMRDKVCEDCERLEKQDLMDGLISEIKAGYIPDDIKQALQVKFDVKPIDVTGQEPPLPF